MKPTLGVEAQTSPVLCLVLSRFLAVLRAAPLKIGYAFVDSQATCMGKKG